MVVPLSATSLLYHANVLYSTASGKILPFHGHRDHWLACVLQHLRMHVAVPSRNLQIWMWPCCARASLIIV